MFLKTFTSLWCTIMHRYAINGMLVKGQWANVNLTCPLKSGSGFKVKGRRHVFFTTDKRKKSLLSLTEAPWTQICFRPHNRGDYCDSARIPSPPHPSQVQLRSEYTLLRQTPEFQRHFIELLRAVLTSTTKYCRGISRLCCGRWKLSVVGNLWGERVQGEGEGEKNLQGDAG